MKKVDWIGMLPFYLLAAIICIGAAVWGSDSVTAAVQNGPVSRDHTIVIDAGHGGVDGGAISCTGMPESHINLQIALRLDDLLHLLGYDTVMIRRTDDSVYTEGNTIAAKKVSDLKQRVKIVNETENAVLISIHQNTFPDSRYSGAQVFYADTQGSRFLAEGLQQAFNHALSGSTRQPKPANSVYLMKNIRATGVLIECGFLSNPQEEAKLRNAKYQQKLCCVIASALREFFTCNG